MGDENGIASADAYFELLLHWAKLEAGAFVAHCCFFSPSVALDVVLGLTSSFLVFVSSFM